MNLLFKNISLVRSEAETTEVVDILILDGKFSEIGKDLTHQKAKQIDGKDLTIFPGFVDLRTHFREPGFEAKETIQTGSRAALQGGYVASVAMPNTNPPCDQQGIVDNILRKAKEVPYNIFPAGTLSKGRNGKELSEMADLKKAGIVAVTDDDVWVSDSLLMRRAMEYASMLDLVLMSHCEDTRLKANGVMNEGFNSTKMGLRGIPSVCEEIAIARDIELAKMTGVHLHIAHLSTARSVELIKRAKKEGVRVTADVTPHHLMLTDDAIEGYNTNFKISPPLRTEADREALIKGLLEGVIDCISTDHAPHTQEDKMSQFDEASFGTTGLETAFSAVLTELYHQRKCPLNRIVQMMSTHPAKIIKIHEKFGEIKVGREANFTVVNLDESWVVRADEFASKSKNSCFIKMKLKGKVKMTGCSGSLWRFDHEN
jgi:dihydroorotase